MSRPTNALIVDDEAHVRLYVKLLLRECGIAATWEAADGRQAFEMIQTHQPELVLLDVNLPYRNGLEILAELQQTQPDLPVVMMTSLTALDVVKQAAEFGAIGYVVKHSPKDEALARLRDTLETLEETEEEPGQAL